MHGSKTTNMPDIRSQLKLLKRKAEEAEPAPKPRFNLWAAIDRGLMEIAVHIPVGVAVGISAYGYSQYGAFAAGLIPLACALSWKLSRTYSMLVTTHRLDVAAFLILIGAGAFVLEAYGVHLGAVRFNEENAANGLQTFDDALLIGASVILGLMNLFSRRAYITGHGKLADESSNPESWWRHARRRDRFMQGLERTNGGRISQLTDDQALHCFDRNGAWPLGFTPSPELVARAGKRRAK